MLITNAPRDVSMGLWGVVIVVSGTIHNPASTDENNMTGINYFDPAQTHLFHVYILHNDISGNLKTLTPPHINDGASII